ncbi:MAG: hypothetical protein U9R15_06025 [Chloroflexota bacterium]|nr:hypothetical protein [Chloroflexota bacterium]
MYGFTVESSEPSAEARRISNLIGDRVVGDEIDTMTDHAWLIVLGYFAQALGLVAGLEAVPLDQRKGPECGPQTKLIEFLVGILGGIEYLQDLNLSDNPIVKDPTVAEAWAQQILVHYSGVSRTLDAADEDTLMAVMEVLQTISRPFIDAAVVETLREEGQLVIDVDLTGREVSPTSTDYDDATFGWMEDGISKGYQAAVTSLVCERWNRLMLILQRYTGRTHSAECLQAAVQAVEELLGVRPRRRVKLLQSRRRELRAQIEETQTNLDHGRGKENILWKQVRETEVEIKDHENTVMKLETEYQAQGRREKSHCKLAKARRKLTAARKRERRIWHDLKKLWRKRDARQRKADELQDDLLSLDERLNYLKTDNQVNLNPVPIVLRIDAGFSTGSNLAWLIEMGYTVLTKAHHSGTANSLRRRLLSTTEWTRVGGNADAVYMGDYLHNDCLYPLQAMLVRYHLPEKTRYTALLYYDESSPPLLPEWFAQYNARQTIEAGIKEGKGVFTLKRHLVRSPVGMKLQEQFALFGANFVRWAAAWVKDMLRQANHHFVTILDQVKPLVRIVSRARARWVRNALGHTLIFDENGPYAGTVIGLSGLVAVQLALKLFKFGPP